MKKNELLVPIIFNDFPFVKAGQSTKIGGVASDFGPNNMGESVGDDASIVSHNRDNFCIDLGFKPEQLGKSKQVHGIKILECSAPGRYEGYDALMTNQANILLAVTIADCVPILLFDRQENCIAAIHAGWKGSLEKLVTKTVEAMTLSYGTYPKNIFAFIGACASGLAYEVGQDVAELFDETYLLKKANADKWLLDLKKQNADQLLALGVPKEQIEVSSHCTITEFETFHSYRAEGKRSGRMLAAIGLMG